MLILGRAGGPVAFLGPEPRAPGLAGRDQFDEIGDEEMTWDEKVKAQS